MTLTPAIAGGAGEASGLEQALGLMPPNRRVRSSPLGQVAIVSCFWGDPTTFATRARAGDATTIFHTVSSAEGGRRAVD